MRTSNRWNILLPLAAVLVGSGCVSTGAVEHDALDFSDALSLRVRNHSWHDVTVYLLLSGGSRSIRVGRVTASTTEVIRLHGQARAQIRSDGSAHFAVRGLGLRAGHVLHPVVVAPSDDHLLVTLENHLALSTVIPSGRR